MNPAPLGAALRHEISGDSDGEGSSAEMLGTRSPDAEATWSGPSMGGRLDVRIATTPATLPDADRMAARVGARVTAWASRLTRFAPTSDLARLNAEPSETFVPVRPTLAAVLVWAGQAARQTGGVLDVTLLDARLAAERTTGDVLSPGRLGPHTSPGQREWLIGRKGRWAVVQRIPGTRFDLDGVAKGWIADRAAALLRAWPGALVDADGDIALHVRPGVEWLVGVAGPQGPGDGLLATFSFVGDRPWRQSFGVATSGTSVHRWRQADGRVAHHLIDPRTLRPAETDLVQATVVAGSAREAEVLAKSAVILGSAAGLRLLQDSTASAAILLKESGETISLAGTGAWLA